MKLSQQISDWIKRQVKNADKKGIVIGLSGGIDSSVVAVLSKKALGGNVLGLILPCQSSSMDERIARKLVKKFDIKVKRVDLTTMFDRLSEVDYGASNLARANLKPRLRMLTLYYFANSLNYLVVGTGNKSELMSGYFTKYGDGGCDILPLGGLLKTEMRSLARELKIPSEIIRRPPTAGLWEGQTDEKEIDMSYEDLDKCLRAIEKGKVSSVKKGNLRKVQLMIRKSNHKRKKIPIFKKK